MTNPLSHKARIAAGRAGTLDALRGEVAAATKASPEELQKLGRRLWTADLCLHDLALQVDDVRRLAKLLPDAAGSALLTAWFDAKGAPANGKGMQELTRHLRSQRVDGDRVTIAVDPSLPSNHFPFALAAAYEAHRAPRVDLVYENGATIKAFGGGAGAAAQLSAAQKRPMLDELRARHFGVKDVDVKDGVVVVAVGHRFDAAYASAVDRQVKRDVGDVPVRIVVDNEGDVPLASQVRGIHVGIHKDGTRSPTLSGLQARDMTARFADLGVVAIASRFDYGTLIQVKHGTTKAQAQAILAAVLEHVPTDYAAVFSSRHAADRPLASDPTQPPEIVADDVLAGRTDFVARGPSSLPHLRKEPYAGLPGGG